MLRQGRATSQSPLDSSQLADIGQRRFRWPATIQHNDLRNALLMLAAVASQGSFAASSSTNSVAPSSGDDVKAGDNISILVKPTIVCEHILSFYLYLLSVASGGSVLPLDVYAFHFELEGTNMFTLGDAGGDPPNEIKSGGPKLEPRRGRGETLVKHGFAPSAPPEQQAWRSIYLIEREAIDLRRLRWRSEQQPISQAVDFAPRVAAAGDSKPHRQRRTLDDAASVPSLAKYMRPEHTEAPPKKGVGRRFMDGVGRLFGRGK